jgi:glycosyltransferase involved in cell wall biosynthesis
MPEELCADKSLDAGLNRIEGNSDAPEILYDVRWFGNHGIGRFAREIQKAIPCLAPYQTLRRPWHPLDPVLLGAALWIRRPQLFFSPGYNSPLGWPGAFVFTLHDLNHLRVPDNSNALKRAYYRYIIRPACHRAQCVLTVSEYSKKEIAAWAEVNEEKIVNVGNGVGPPFSAAGQKYDPGYPYLLYVGSRKPHKNLPRLLQAYAVSGMQQDVRLVISGEADSAIVAELDHLKITDVVEFRGLSNDQDLADAYRGAMGLLFPSLYEGFGLPPLEAMACGTPVLTSNICSLPEVTGEAAILVDPLQVEDISDGIKRLVRDSKLRAAMRDMGLERSHLFTWSETARKTSQALALAQEMTTS